MLYKRTIKTRYNIISINNFIHFDIIFVPVELDRHILVSNKQ